MKKNIRKTAYADGKVMRAITSIVFATRIGCGGSFFRTCTKHVSVAQPLFAECVQGLVPPAQLVHATISFGPPDSRFFTPKLVSMSPASLSRVSTVGRRRVSPGSGEAGRVPSSHSLTTLLAWPPVAVVLAIGGGVATAVAVAGGGGGGGVGCKLRCGGV